MKCFTIVSLVVVAVTSGHCEAEACNGGYGFNSVPRYVTPVYPRTPVYYRGPRVVHSPVPRMSSPRIAGASRTPRIRVVPTQSVSLPRRAGQLQQQAAPQQVVPQASPQQRVQTAPQASQSSQQGTDDNTGGMSALAILAGQNAVETNRSATSTQPPAARPSHLGRWVATLPNQATIELDLADDGNFSWTAINNGKTSRFAGQFTLRSEKLTLSRSSDSQQLAGLLTQNGADEFNFKLDGAKDSGLTFRRQS